MRISNLELVFFSVGMVAVFFSAAHAQKPEQLVRPLMARMEGAGGSAAVSAVRAEMTRPVFAAYQAQQAQDNEVPRALLQPENPEDTEETETEGSNSIATPALLGVAGGTGALALLTLIAPLPWELSAVFGGIALVTGAVGLVLWLSQRNSKP